MLGGDELGVQVRIGALLLAALPVRLNHLLPHLPHLHTHPTSSIQAQIQDDGTGITDLVNQDWYAILVLLYV